MTMTEKEVERILDVWIDRLKLQHWEVKWGTFDDLPQNPSSPTKFQENEQALIWRQKDYHTAILILDDYWYEWDELKMNVNIVHELLHLQCRELENIIDWIDGLLAPVVDSLITDNYDHALEGVIDALARRFVELAGLA